MSIIYRYGKLPKMNFRHSNLKLIFKTIFYIIVVIITIVFCLETHKLIIKLKKYHE